MATPETINNATETVLECRDVAKKFGRTHALRGVSFAVPKGSIYGLLGPNGAGKTTLFSVAANFLKADQGDIKVAGVDSRDVGNLRGKLGILPQDARFQRHITLIEQLMFFQRLAGASRRVAMEQAFEALTMVSLEKDANRYPPELSHGMQKRLGLAQAFLGKPEVIFLDEPTAGLDPENAAQVRQQIQAFREANVTIIISSHHLAEIQELCDHAAILHRGKVRAAGSMEKLMRQGNRIQCTLSAELAEDELEEIEAMEGVVKIKPEGRRRYRVEFAPNEDMDRHLGPFLQKLIDFKALPHRITPAQTLEERFLEIIKK
jgi:ABC-type multidrug transport system ATPase subunit